MNIFSGSVFEKWRYLSKMMFLCCDLDCWPFKVKFCKNDMCPFLYLCAKFQRNLSKNEEFIFRKILIFFEVTWRKNGTSHVKSDSTTEKANTTGINFGTNRKSLSWLVQKLWLIMWFRPLWWPWPWPLVDFEKKIPVPTRWLTRISVRISAWSV